MLYIIFTCRSANHSPNSTLANFSLNHTLAFCILLLLLVLLFAFLLPSSSFWRIKVSFRVGIRVNPFTRLPCSCLAFLLAMLDNLHNGIQMSTKFVDLYEKFINALQERTVAAMRAMPRLPPNASLYQSPKSQHTKIAKRDRFRFN